MFKGYEKETGKSRVIDIVTSINQGYLYDMPVSRHTLKSYTTATRVTAIFDISNKQINEWNF